MGFRCGLVGLPNVGKSTLFNALSASQAEVANYPFTTIEPNRAVVAVPDDRLAELARLLRPEKVTPTQIRFVDIAGLVKGASRGEGLGNQFLGHIRDVQVVVHVLRCFEDPDVAHVEGSVDPLRDAEVVRTELMLADLEILERRCEKLAKTAKAGTREAREELDRCKRFQERISGGAKGLRQAFKDGEDENRAEEWGLLTHKPAILVANVDEKEWSNPTIVPRLKQGLGDEPVPLITICGALEAEIVRLNAEERQEFLDDLGIQESGLNKLIRVGHQLLGLITFYTTVGRELRAWSLPVGTSALVGAGKIHTDMARGFIRAEVVPFDAFVQSGSAAQARESGKMRLEGKEYVIADGDVVTFRFSV
ncbi:MAG: redox-regulated ATPase YchF [Deltaproteobacteria bacterium]|nr:redox-regulated ATPase YchF [Deltaproteobacteria bacterium]